MKNDFIKRSLYKVDTDTPDWITLTSIAIGVFYRGDLQFSKGKKAVQGAHGVVSTLFLPHLRTKYHDLWLGSSSRRIIVFKVKNINQLLKVQQLCQYYGTNENLITDAGHTQLAPGTRTVVAVGPIYEHWINILAENLI